jgi:dTDP-4-dehydrorhamnose reductase
MTKRLLVLGGSGFIGQNLVRYFAERPYHVYAPPREVVDLLLLESVTYTIQKYRPDFVINAAGMKDQAKADADPTATIVNAIGPRNLGDACWKADANLIHISSDHVLAEPSTNYGLSKLAGENAIKNQPCVILRTGHVYGRRCPWLTWLDMKLKAGRQVEAWSDICNRPTYLEDLAMQIQALINRWEPVGIVTFVGPDEVSRVDLFKTYARVFGYPASLIVPVKNKAPAYYPRKIRYEGFAFQTRVVRNIDEGFRALLSTAKNSKHFHATAHA